jgi:predicted helicase
MPSLTLKPTHKAVTAYYDSLAQFETRGIKHETAVRSAFQELLEHCARQFDWKLVPEYPIKRKSRADAKADVYTPQPLVDFMVASVEKILTAEFGRTLADKGVHILDPFTGTGNFLGKYILAA